MVLITISDAKPDAEIRFGRWILLAGVRQQAATALCLEQAAMSFVAAIPPIPFPTAATVVMISSTSLAAMTKSIRGPAMTSSIPAQARTRSMAVLAMTPSGGTGNESFYGVTGNDRLQGDVGSETFYGDMGNDVMYGGDGYDQPIMHPLEGPTETIPTGNGNGVTTNASGNTSYFGSVLLDDRTTLNFSQVEGGEVENSPRGDHCKLSH